LLDQKSAPEIKISSLIPKILRHREEKLVEKLASQYNQAKSKKLKF
jgi:hypothetical protein